MNQLPNLLTCLRILLIPVLVWLILAHNYPMALLVIVVAGLTDALDGLLAKRFGWVTDFGSIADPLADKLLLISAFACLAVIGLLPWWLFILTSIRDAIIVAGAIAYQLLVDKVTGQPNWASKANTTMQIILVILVLIVACGYQSLKDVITPAIWTVCTLSGISLVQYVWVWSAKTAHHYKSERSV